MSVNLKKDKFAEFYSKKSSPTVIKQRSVISKSRKNSGKLTLLSNKENKYEEQKSKRSSLK